MKILVCRGLSVYALIPQKKSTRTWTACTKTADFGPRGCRRSVCMEWHAHLELQSVVLLPVAFSRLVRALGGSAASSFGSPGSLRDPDRAAPGGQDIRSLDVERPVFADL